jgi:gamma-glutamylcyclotransferase (GGCT)/AIG2-like uncharacterized protein YtfP
VNENQHRSIRLFVYGTLMPGQANHHRIEAHVKSTRPGTIQGVLVDLRAFPALVPGEGTVHGVLLEIDEAALAATDWIEGCGTDREHSLYVRKQVAVQLDDGQRVTAWAYEYANPDRIRDRPRLKVSQIAGVACHEWSGRRRVPRHGRTGHGGPGTGEIAA